MKRKILMFLGSAFLCLGLFPMIAFAEEAAHAAGEVGVGNGLLGIGRALAIGLAAFGGGLGQGRAAAAALEGTARNPGAYKNIFTVWIVSLILIESLVLYALLIAFVKI